ncbi:MAG: MarC family protein [Candidatus Aenigmarchaeota archaeon]|nr:MarC family protein [Candidatus Aenigmarchaeota archaeon]
MPTEYISAVILLFVIMDPFGSIPYLMKATQGFRKPRRAAGANRATLIAGGVILVFAIFGAYILSIFSIDAASFRIAGGLVLAILGLQLVLGISLTHEKKKDYDTAIIVIGTPMITGPGVITTIILLEGSMGLVMTLAAAFTALFLTWLTLRLSVSIQKTVGSQLVEIISRIFGILLVAMAISFIRAAIFLPVAA